MRITKSIIKDLSILMIGFGIMIGIIFPFFIMLFGIDHSIALSPYFMLSCILAGACVGIMNIFLSKSIVVRRLKATTDKMLMITENVIKIAQGNTHEKCDFDICQLKVDSEDEIGRNAKAYNTLVETLALTMSGEELISHLDQETIVNKSLTQIIDITHSSAGCILIEKEGDLVIAQSYGIKDAEGLTHNEIVLSVASNHKPAHMKLPDDIVIDGILSTVRPREVLVEPLEFKGSRIGVVVTASTSTYDNSSIEKLRVQLKNLSLALHNAIIHERIQELAAIDPLTGLLNRRFGMTRFKDEYCRSVRTNSPLGVIMLDLDHFKKINDNYGHLAGDKVLVSCAKTIKQLLREGDDTLRYGGEEFLIILPGASLKDTFDLSEKIRRVIEESPIIYGGFEIRVTCSMGIASIPECSVTTEEDLLLKVDKALYYSKNKGRNRVTQVRI